MPDSSTTLAAEARQMPVPSSKPPGDRPPGEPTDDAIMAAVQNGDHGQFELLYTRHAPSLLLWLLARCPATAPADDVAHEAWVKVVTCPNTYRGGDFRGWLFTIARNLMIDLIRRGRRTHIGGNEDQLAAVADPAQGEPVDVMIDEEDRAVIDERGRQALARCLKRLSADELVVVQSRLGNVPYEKIAKLLNRTPNALGQVFHTAKKKLTACVQGGGA